MKSSNPFALLVLALAAIACGKKEAVTLPADVFPVRVASVRRLTVEEVLTLVGTVKAKDEATLFSRVSGKLVENLVKEGDRVKIDQPVSLVRRDEVGVEYKPAPVLSTLTGIVGRVYLDRGAEVGLNTPVVLVVDDSRMLVRSEVPERYAGRIATGQRVRVQVAARAETDVEGRITRVSPVVDPATRAVPMEVTLISSPGFLKSGMFASLSVVTSSKAGALTVPVDAIVEEGDPAVFVVADGKAHRRPVAAGVRSETAVEILSGLAEGDSVVVFGLFGLEDGSPVEVLKDSAP
ncbi:MAG: efflux RND transporter periplasmic adaptor subunit [Elusimicrobia bacterium]|nr:efflux RND transporter periplasmic adaptor subunit [Elusimicrobiota bacterium]MBP9699064.1 efflux RND transporter periplasmic adaptor subunit [Elusimicrobiota bacterium]